MSKASSGHFSGTKGAKYNSSTPKIESPEAIIARRTQGLDLSPHPRKEKSMSVSQMQTIKNKINSRTASKEEYQALMSENRFRKRRSKAVLDFWKDEASRIKNHLPTTRQ